MRREVPLLITFLVGMFLIFDNFIGPAEAGAFAKHWHLIAQNVKTWVLIVISFTYVLGVGNVARIHVNKVRKKEKDWIYSIVTLTGLFVMIFIGIILWIPFHTITGEGGPGWYSNLGHKEGSMFDWFYQSIYTPMQATMFSLLAFFISSAAFRAFRVRSFQASLLAVTAVIVIMGRVTLGELISPKLPEFVDWIMSCLQMAGKRAILIGAALGAVSTGLKMILGIERTYLSGE